MQSKHIITIKKIFLLFTLPLICGTLAIVSLIDIIKFFVDHTQVTEYLLFIVVGCFFSPLILVLGLCIIGMFIKNSTFEKYNIPKIQRNTIGGIYDVLKYKIEKDNK